jgi:PAS domain S-box-containing protein
MHDVSELIFQSISDGVFTVDENRIITAFNRAAEEITGFEAREAVGRHCFDIFRTELCHTRCPLKDTLQHHDQVEDARVSILTKEGCELPIGVTTTVLRNDPGTPGRGGGGVLPGPLGVWRTCTGGWTSAGAGRHRQRES